MAITNFTIDKSNYQFFGINKTTQAALEALTGTQATVGFLRGETKGTWGSTPNINHLKAKCPMFVTTTYRASVGEDTHHLADGVWIDLDASDLKCAISDAKNVAQLLRRRDIDPQTCSLFASGGKGFHVFIPVRHMGAAMNAEEARAWPRICKEWVRGMVTDCMDMSLYAGRSGKLIRQANVKRANGFYKVPMHWDALDGMTPNGYRELCAAPRPFLPSVSVMKPANGAAEAWAKAKTEVAKAVPKSAPKNAEEPLSDDEVMKLYAALEVLRAAVADGSLSYEDWLRVGAGLKGDGRVHNGLELWTWVSEPHKGHRDRNATARWDGLTGKDCSLGTVFYIARKNGGAA